MIHNDVQNQLQLLIKTSAPPLIEVSDHATASPQWAPGQRLPAHVIASLPNGRFEVRVGDQILDLNLPRNTQTGDSVELTYVGDKPRLTFALSQDIANLAPAKTPVSLSETARFIGSLVQKGAEGDAQAAHVGRSAPVVNTLPASVADFAQSLRQAVAQSGLFYESHQAQWVGGERSLAALLQEPQGQLSPLLGQARATAVPTPQTTAAPAGQAMPEAASSGQAAASVPTAPGANVEEAVRPWSTGMAEVGNAASGAAANASGKAASEPVHPQATQLVQQQLQTLDTRQLVWQGQVWPGQEMYWEIEEEPNRSGGEAEYEADAWQTRLSLQLPAMGGVSARIAFVQGALRLEILAEQTGSVELMRSRQAQLVQGFQAAGLSLAGVSIGHEQT